MHVCGQTLVLVDNDATVSAVNQKLTKATLKYLFYHMPENRTFCLSEYGHDLTSVEDYSQEVNDLVCRADGIEYEAKDQNLTDTLSEVLTRWKESDFACRDILVFTDGLEGAATEHEKEELFYLIENSEYPIYIVMLDQEDNAAAKKSLSAISVTSGGRFFTTEFEGSDAEVDKQLTEKIYSAMDEYALVNWSKYEESDEEEEAGEGSYTEENEVSDNTQMTQAVMDERVVYEYERTPGFFESSGALILSAALVAAGILIAVIGTLTVMKRKRKDRVCRTDTGTDEPELFDDYELGGMSTTELSGDTVFLDEKEDEGFGPTRLLDDGRLVTLKDTTDDRRCYKIMLKGMMSIGRGDCDVVITGDDALSKRHCELYENDGNVHVRDLSSSNGTKVNSIKIKDESLSDGDELTIGARTYLVGIA